MGSKIILGITGSIAAYKSIELAKALSLLAFDVHIVLSKMAPQFVSVSGLKALFPGKVYEHDATLGEDDEMLHISLAKAAEFVLIAPASANIISKLAIGGADCLLSTLCLATNATIVLAPAMNKIMWANALVQRNIATLKEVGVRIVGPASGEQACGDVGMGRMTEPLEIAEYVLKLKTPRILQGKKIIVTAGPTREGIDPVRFLSNYSSGKMGYAIAEAARNMGADVTLVSGPTALEAPHSLKVIYAETASDMLKTVEAAITGTSIFIGVAAVADYRPEDYSIEKIKKDQGTIAFNLTKNTDIIQTVKQRHPEVFCVGFAAESNDIKKHGYKKLQDKGLDMIAINDISKNKVFGSDYNELHILTKDQQYFHLEHDTKTVIARGLLLEIVSESFKCKVS